MKMTNKKFIEEMTKEERTEVFNKNTGLQHKVLDDMQDSEMDWIGEKLDYIREHLSDWSVGTGARPYIYASTMNGTRTMSGILEGLKKMDAEVPAFGDDKAAEVIGNLEKAIDEYFDAESDRDDYDDLEEAAEKAVQTALDELAAQFEKDLNYCYDSDTQLSYFLEFYADARMDDEETFYIIPEEGTYKLYEDVAYTKTFE